jgi:predicted Zn-ribbon and HTH transcriptional regulator
MASESTRERTVTITIPAELDDWLDEQATKRDVDRDTLLSQLLAAYQTTAKYNGELEGEIQTFESDHIETLIEDQIEQQFPGDSETAAALKDRIDTIGSEHEQKITELHNRVVQIKKELDAKAPEDHDHSEFEHLRELAARVEALGDELNALREESETEDDDQLAEFDDRLEEVEDRLQSVAWLVGNLRDTVEEDDTLDVADRIKRAAAESNIEQAKCQNCGETVSIGLLTEPECPHCNTAVRDVEPSSGWFGKPELRTASELDSGENA